MHKRDIITIIILLVIFGFAFLIIWGLNNKEKEEENEVSKISILRDERTYLSIEKNINRISRYSVSEGNKINLFVKNEIDINRYKNVSFKANEIYEVNKKNLYKYFVKGSFYQSTMDTVGVFIRDEYFILNYDMNSDSYNIEIIDKDKYDSAKLQKEEYIFEEIDKNEYNKIEYVNLSDKTRATMYFNDYINKLYLNQDEAYNLLTEDTKDIYFNTLDDFKNFISMYDNISLKEYAIDDNKIGIKDNYGNEYIFEIIYILKYNVTIYKAEE